MDMYKLLAIVFIFLTLAFTYVLVSIFKLRRFDLNAADLALPLYALELVLVSGHFFVHHYLPFYAILMSLLALILTIYQVRTTQRFHFRAFFKFFWRFGFFVTLAAYIMTVLAVFLMG
ncbi:DUF3397 family protein [Streptococcus porcorum]|uniref:Integral membrane protein n=1 Tax=Streptococcus porcorum TaxID=701526 RepID=A0ABV2JFI2_9STRE